MKRVLSMILVLAMSVSMAACGQKGTEGSSSAAQSASQPAASASSSASSSTASGSGSGLAAIDYPLGKPVEDRADTAQRISDALAGTGEYADCPVATLETSEGVVKLRLFPQEAPRTVENFVTHAKDGYYDGLAFHRVINGFMIQGGDPLGTGAGGESIWGGSFEDEFSDVLHNFRGAISMANTGKSSTNGSQFFIVQSNQPIPDEQTDTVLQTLYFQRELANAQLQLLQAQKDGAAEAELDKLMEELNQQLTEKQTAGPSQEYKNKQAPAMERYKAAGGAYYLDYKHTVFGYVIEGMDVVDAIAALDTGETASGQPAGKTSKPVTITKITIEE